VYSSSDLRIEEIIPVLPEIYEGGEIGAVALYIGVTRAQSRDGREVEMLEIEAYEENANLEIDRICREVKEKHGVAYVGIWHLQGRFKPGEPLVLVVAAGGHREQVIKALHEAIERYKKEPALFKKEVYVDGMHLWISE